jgi:dTMP kinase
MSFLIGIDGINGVGKSTLIDNLRNEYPNAVFVREPGATDLGVKLRELILYRTETIVPLSEYLLFAADHVQTFKKIVEPALEAGKMVFTDRTYISSLAFQGSMGVPTDLIINLSHMVRGYDLMIVLDGDTQECLDRLKAKDSIESKPFEYHEMVRQKYIQWCENIIDTRGKNSVEVFLEVVKLINEKL